MTLWLRFKLTDSSPLVHHARGKSGWMTIALCKVFERVATRLCWLQHHPECGLVMRSRTLNGAGSPHHISTMDHQLSTSNYDIGTIHYPTVLWHTSIAAS